MTLKVLIVEDETVVAAGFAALLGKEPTLRVVGVASNRAEALALAAAERPDVVLTDYRMPEANGAEVTAALRTILPDTKVILLSGGPTPEELLQSIEAGACGYLLKTIGPEALIEAIYRAAAGEPLLDGATIAELMAHRRRHDTETAERRRVLESLTPREREVLALMAQGADARGIAERLVISLHTARMHTQNVIEKLGAHSKLEAVLRANDLQLLA